MNAGWILSQPYGGPADNQIGQKREADVEKIKDKMADEGIMWTDSDKSAGSRKNGVQLMRDRLKQPNEAKGQLSTSWTTVLPQYLPFQFFLVMKMTKTMLILNPKIILGMIRAIASWLAMNAQLNTSQ